MKTLVIGFGSIGSRHARLLTDLGHMVAVVSKREVDFSLRYTDIDTALGDFQPEYVVIANNTYEHIETLNVLAKRRYNGYVLVEKPLFASPDTFPCNSFKAVFVAYNLRFHPIIQQLKVILATKKIVSAHVYAGQYLPYWRPQTDYKLSYSAKSMYGGGVLRDLSHELDYTTWLLGRWQRLTAIGGQFSSLEIDSSDVYSILMTTELCPVAYIHVNYLERSPRRQILINTDEDSIEADLVSGILRINDEVQSFKIGRDETYLAQHLAIAGGDVQHLCSLNEGMDIVNMISDCERAMEQRRWICR